MPVEGSTVVCEKMTRSTKCNLGKPPSMQGNRLWQPKMDQALKERSGSKLIPEGSLAEEEEELAAKRSTCFTS